MGILGKDLFRFDKSYFDITALFTADNYQIESQTYRYGELTTAFLNYDAGLFFKTISELDKAESVEQFNKQAHVANFAIKLMPLYKHQGYMSCEPEFITLCTRFGDKFDRDLEHYIRLADDIRMVQDRYTWLLKEMQEKESKKRGHYCANQLYENAVEAYISGRSLGASSEWDPPAVNIQYEVREAANDGVWQLFEKMEFNRLIDLLYVELFKGMLIGNYPKQCKNCGRWFLKEKNSAFEYCDGIAPGEETKTCRDVGARSSFGDKVKNNEVWRLHQRAYKKYYARVMKKTMTKDEFFTWATEAEQLRDRVLEEYDKALRKGAEYDLTEYRSALNVM